MYKKTISIILLMTFIFSALALANDSLYSNETNMTIMTNLWVNESTNYTYENYTNTTLVMVVPNETETIIPNVTTMPEPEPIIIAPTIPSESVQTYSNQLSIQCKDEWNRVMGMQPGENIKRYCNLVDFRVFILLIIVFIIWLTEPVLKNKLAEDYKYISYVYKWIGLGLLFMAGYLLFSRSFV